MRRALALLAVLFTFAAVAACSGGGGVTTTDTTDAAEPTPGGDDGQLFVSIEVGGGFVPVGHDFGTLPMAVVYDDGTTFAPGATTAIYPGTAVPPVIQGELAQDQLDEIAEAATDAGLLGDEPLDAGEPPIADAATTTVTVVVDGERHVTSVYALGAGGGLPGEPSDGAGSGLDDEQRAAREQVSAFVDLVSRMVTESEQGLHEPERYRVLPLEVQSPDAGVEANEVEWPLDDVELTLMTCTAIEGEQVDELAPLLADATTITQWRTGPGQVFNLVVRPLLPHEPGCPETGSN